MNVRPTFANASPTFRDAVEKLERFGPARDRMTDREVRTFELTDDEALALLEALYGKP